LEEENLTARERVFSLFFLAKMKIQSVTRARGERLIFFKFQPSDVIDARVSILQCCLSFDDCIE